MSRQSIVKVVLLSVAAVLGCVIGNSFAGKPPRSRRPAQQPAKPAAIPNFVIPEPNGAREAREKALAQGKIDNLSYKGTKVGVRTDLAHAVRTVHQQLAAEFSRLEPSPAERQPRFQPLFDARPEIKLTGWHGFILGTEERPDGIHLRVKVTPSIAAPDAGLLHYTDYWIENYLYSPRDKTLTFLGGEEPAELPLKALMID